MLTMTDIYHYVEITLALGDYWNLEPEERKNLIDLALREYLAKKVIMLDQSGNYLLEDVVQKDVVDIMAILENLIPPEKHFDTLRHVVHCVLNFASNLQEYYVVWFESEDEECIKNPQAVFNNDGKWEKFTTHKQTSYKDALKVCYELMLANYTIQR